MKNTIIALLAILCLTGCSKSFFPKAITSEEMEVITKTMGEPEGYYRVFGQYLQKENGEFPSVFDKVLITKQENDCEIGFYRNLGDKFILIDNPVTVTDVYGASASANNEFDVPCIQSIKKDGTETNQVFVLKGKVTHQIGTTRGRTLR